MNHIFCVAEWTGAMAAVIEFKSGRAYEFWLLAMGNKVRILNVSTTKRWSLWTGFLGDAKTYTVTYEQIPSARAHSVIPPQPALNPVAGYCNSCGSTLHVGSHFCSSCGATVEPHSARNGTAGSIQGRATLTALEAECAVCKSLNPLDALVCINCGKALTQRSSSPAQEPGVAGVLLSSATQAIPEKGYRSQKMATLVLVFCALGLCVIIILATVWRSGPSRLKADQSEPSTRPSAAPPKGDEHDHQQRATLKPPTYRVYKSTTEVGTAYIVAVSTTDEELKNLLWFFRRKVRAGAFGDIGITKPTSKNWGQHNYGAGMLLVYRGAKCANEEFISDAQVEKGDLGACGYGEHDDAYYQWGINADPAKDSGAIRRHQRFSTTKTIGTHPQKFPKPLTTR